MRVRVEWVHTAIHGCTGKPLGGRQVPTVKQR